MKKFIFTLLLFFVSSHLCSADEVTLYVTADACLRSGYGNSGASSTCYAPGSDTGAAVFNFDLSSLTGATITSATFSIEEDMRDWGHNVIAYRLLRTFIENQVDWDIYSTGNYWTTAGAKSDGNDYSSADPDTQANGNGGDWIHFDVTDIVQAVADGGAFGGFIVRSADATGGDFWRMRELGDEHRATLEVVYTQEEEPTSRRAVLVQ